MTPHAFRVRWYQRPFHEALVQRTHDRLIAIWHRRAGKDEIVINAMRDLALRDPGTYWHCFPEQKQARKAIWNGVNGHTGKRRIDEAFPPAIRKRMQDDDMFIELNNGATFQLIGSDRYDSTVGSGPKGIAYSEWALSNPAAWAYHSPMIRETKGFAAFITTPRGDNHAKTMYDRAQRSPDTWFSQLLSVEDTGALTAAQLAEALAEYQDLHGIDLGLSLFEQEYLCSFAGAMVGAYFGAEMARAERQGRVRELEIDRTQPVHTVWDLGKAINNPIWCFQVIGGQPRIVDFYRPDSNDLDDWVRWLNDKGYQGTDYVPHDIIVTEWGSSRTRLSLLQSKRKSVRRLPMVSVADGQQAARQTINAAVFHRSDDPTDERSERMALGINGLKSYRREYDEDLKRFSDTPLKDWAEHIGSAFRYLGLAWREVAPPVVKVEKPTRLAYEARADGSVVGNMSVKDAVDAMVRRRRMND
jgi:phage terminase large subunit